MKKIFIILLFLTIGKNSYAFLRFNKKPNQKKEIYITDFYYTNKTTNEATKKNKSTTFLKQVLNIVEEDLLSTGYFKIKKKIFIKENTEDQEKILEKLKKFKHNKITGFFKQIQPNQLELKILLKTTSKDNFILEKVYIINKNNWQKETHSISEEIYSFITKKPINHFNSKILYVIKAGKKYKIITMDFDGNNSKTILNSNNIISNPVFSKTNKNEIIYCEQNPLNLITKIKKLSIKEKTTANIEEFSEKSYTPNSHPKEKVILFAATDNNYSNIYSLNLDENLIYKLTYDKAYNTEPAFSPDGKKIVFQSNKSESKKLYTMNQDGKNIKKITHNRGDYSQPSWSPNEKWIAFSKSHNNKSSIGIITPKGESEKILTYGISTANPKWSSNSEYIMYSKKLKNNDKSYIFIKNIKNNYEYKLLTPLNKDVVDLDWIDN